MSLSIALLVLYFGVLYTETNKKDCCSRERAHMMTAFGWLSSELVWNASRFS